MHKTNLKWWKQQQNTQNSVQTNILIFLRAILIGPAMLQGHKSKTKCNSFNLLIKQLLEINSDSVTW